MTATAPIPPGWITAPTSGHNRNQVMRWRKAGRLVDGRDCLSVEVTIAGCIKRQVWYYCPAALTRELQRDQAAKVPHADRMKERWARSEQLREDEGVLLRQKVAAAFLGISPRQLRLWSDKDGDGCPELGGEVIPTVTRMTSNNTPARYWLRRDLERVKRARAGRPRELTGEFYTFDETAGFLPNVPKKVLRDAAQRLERFGLVGVERPVAAPDQTRLVIGFTRASVEECARRFPPPTIPRGKVTAGEAARRLGLSRPGVLIWVRKGWLSGEWADEIPTAVGICAGWLIDRKSVQDAKRLIDRKGYHKAGEQLRRRGRPAASIPAAASGTDGQVLVKDGPADPYLFRYGRQEVNLARAPLRFQLLRLLWNAATAAPFKARETSDVLAELYGDDETDGAFKNLRFHTNRDLATGKIGMRVRADGGMVWLEELD